MFNVAIENVFSGIFIQGGDETGKILAGGFTKIHHENCIAIKVHHSDKIKNGILFITRSALYDFASKVGLGILDLKVVKVSSWLAFVKKTLATILASAPIPVIGIRGAIIMTVVLSVVTFLSGTASMFLLRESGILLIKTPSIVGPISHITQCIQDRTDVLVIYLEPSIDRISIRESSGPYKCSVPDQRLGNPTCVRKAEIDKTTIMLGAQFL